MDINEAREFYKNQRVLSDAQEKYVVSEIKKSISNGAGYCRFTQVDFDNVKLPWDEIQYRVAFRFRELGYNVGTPDTHIDIHGWAD